MESGEENEMTKIEKLRLNMLRYHDDADVELFDELVHAATCGYLDLIGSNQAYESTDFAVHDWRAHQQSIDELESVLE